MPINDTYLKSAPSALAGASFFDPYVRRDVPGFEDITTDIRRGAGFWYDKNNIGKTRFFTGPGERVYAMNEWATEPDLTDLKEVPYSQVRSMLPKRDYIGGEPLEARIAAVKRVPGLTDKIYERARAYGVDPNLMMHRFLREGYVDNIIKAYNGDKTGAFEPIYADQQKGYFDTLWNDNDLSGYNSFGLDYAGDELMDDKYSLLDPKATWESMSWADDEGKGNRYGNTVVGDLRSMIEIMAAAMKWRHSLATDKYGSGDDEWRYTNAMWNMGQNNDKLDDIDYVRENYSYPEYYSKYGLHYDDGGTLKRILSVYGNDVDSVRAAMKGLKANKFYDGGKEDTYEGGMLPDVDIKPEKKPGWFMKTLMHGALQDTPQYFNSATGLQMTEEGLKQDSNVWSDDAPEQRLRTGLAMMGAAPIIGTAGEWYPVASKVLDPLFTIDGVYNFFTDNGVEKTVRLGKEGKYLPMLKSAAGDVLDIAGGVGFGKRLIKSTNELVRKSDVLRKFGWDAGDDARAIANGYNYSHFIDEPNRHLVESFIGRLLPYPDYNFKVNLSENGTIDRIRSKFPIDAEGNYIRFPEYETFLERNPGFERMSQESIDEFARRQSSALRGVYGKPEELEHFATEPRPYGSWHTGGDRLGTKGGLYTSNSGSIANSFSNSQQSGKDIIGGIGQVEFPLKYDRSLPPEEQLLQLRSNIFGYDDILRNGRISLVRADEVSDAAREVGLQIGESAYTNRFGDILPATERVWLGHEPLKLNNMSTHTNNTYLGGRWGIGGVDKQDIDESLFIPFRYSVADEPKLQSLLSQLNVTDLKRITEANANDEAKLQKIVDRLKATKEYKKGYEAGLNGGSMFTPYTGVQVVPATMTGVYGSLFATPLAYEAHSAIKDKKEKENLVQNMNILRPINYFGDDWNNMSVLEKAEAALYDKGYRSWKDNFSKSLIDGLQLGDNITIDDGRFNEHRNGGKIHIKPSHRGRFTELKKRTGHSATWFKKNGTPAQRKMATFDLNVRKWKHGDGGPIQRAMESNPQALLDAVRKLRSKA